MKRMRMALALAAAVCVLLSACGGGGTGSSENGEKGGVVTDSGTGTGKSGGEYEEGSGLPASAESAPGYGELPGRKTGCYYSGTTVVFDYGAFTASKDGIYFIDAVEGSPLMVVEDTIIFDTAICTDGFTAYYVNVGGELIEASLENGGQRQVTNGAGFPFRTGVTGVGENVAYVTVPGNYENPEAAGDLDSVCAVSLETGETLSTWDSFAGAGCAGGCTAIFAQGYDVSPRELIVFAPDGAAVVDEPWAMGATATGGEIWYCSTESESIGAVTLSRVGSDGPVTMLEWEAPEDTIPYGMFVRGYAASSYYLDTDGNMGVDSYDIRTMEPLSAPDGIPVYDAYTVEGREYLIGNAEVYLWEDGQASCIFELPEELRECTIHLCGEHVLLDGQGGEFYVLPLDPENTVHTIPVTAAVNTLEEYDGKNGATVIGRYPLLLSANFLTRHPLSEAVAEYNEAAYEATKANAAACASQASDLIENGFATPNDPFSVSTRAYIQRADTLAFTFMEHQTMDNRVNRGVLDKRTGYNFDSTDGHSLTLEEVITDEDAFRNILLAYLVEGGFAEREEAEEYLFQLFRSRSLTSTDQFSWVLGYEGVSFYFNGNVNFPYAARAVKVTIPFEDYPEMFNPKYFAVPDTYASDVLLDTYFTEEYRTQSADHNEYLQILARNDENDTHLEIVYNGLGHTIPVYGSLVSATLFHDCGGTVNDGQPRTGGQNYLALQTWDGTYMLDVVDLDAECAEAWDFGQVVLPQNLPMDEDWDYASMGQQPVHTWLSNPVCFSLLSYDESTENYTVRAVYDFNDGMPILLDCFGASLAVG